MVGACLVLWINGGTVDAQCVPCEITELQWVDYVPPGYGDCATSIPPNYEASNFVWNTKACGSDEILSTTVNGCISSLGTSPGLSHRLSVLVA